MAAAVGELDVVTGSIRRPDGKRSLWQALAAVAPMFSASTGLDFARLEERAEDQQAGLGMRRLDSARVALVDPPAA